MIKEVNQACEKLNDTLGITVKLPNPKKKALKAKRRRAQKVTYRKSCPLYSGMQALYACHPADAARFFRLLSSYII